MSRHEIAKGRQPGDGSGHDAALAAHLKNDHGERFPVVADDQRGA
jgi:hypothetical protein